MTTQKVVSKRAIIFIAVLAISFILTASSLTENARAATPAPSTEPTSTPEPANQINTTSSFAYDAIGKEFSSLRAPNTITLCNYTTPSDTGVIVQISIYLKGIPKGSHVWAVIFADEPDANFPQGAEPHAQSLESLNVTSVSGEWYNFTMNYLAPQNTVYWLGYYSDNYTQYSFDADSNHLTVTSQPKDANWLPVGWNYDRTSIMSLYALYTVAAPQPTPTSAHTSSPNSFQDTVFVLLIMSAESVIVVNDKNREKKNAARKQ